MQLSSPSSVKSDTTTSVKDEPLRDQLAPDDHKGIVPTDVPETSPSIQTAQSDPEQGQSTNSTGIAGGTSSTLPDGNLVANGDLPTATTISTAVTGGIPVSTPISTPVNGNNSISTTVNGSAPISTTTNGGIPSSTPVSTTNTGISSVPISTINPTVNGVTSTPQSPVY